MYTLDQHMNDCRLRSILGRAAVNDCHTRTMSPRAGKLRIALNYLQKALGIEERADADVSQTHLNLCAT